MIVSWVGLSLRDVTGEFLGRFIIQLSNIFWGVLGEFGVGLGWKLKFDWMTSWFLRFLGLFVG